MTTPTCSPDAGLDKNRRSTKHITRACLGCRRRKAKCNGATPKCANCLLYDQECIMPRGIDKRKFPPKDRLSAIMSYVETLESLLQNHGIGFPKRPDALPPLYPSPAQKHNEAETPTWKNSSPQTALSVRRGSMLSEANSNTLATIIDQLTDTVGSMQIAEDGELHYFGATSNLHILHVGSLSLSDSPHIPANQGGHKEILRAYGVDHEVDEELEDHLIKLYFSWEDPNIPVVDQDTFFQERQRCRNGNEKSRKYSEVLTNAMCAVGATLTSRYCQNLPEDLPSFFLTRAKVLLEMELNTPMLCTVQSLVILSGMEAVFTRDTRGWLFSGMAMRLAVDLGLHIEVQEPSNDTSIDPEEERLRSRIFWGAFIHDRMWSLYVGRPESLSDEYITISRPTRPDTFTNATNTWQLYVDDNLKNPQNGASRLLEDVRCELISLCSKIPAIRRALYTTSPKSAVDIGRLYQLSLTMGEELAAWHRRLPEELSLDPSDIHGCSLPHVLQLHMQFHAIRIIVDRPFLSLASNTSLSEQKILHSQKSCFDAASSIAQLIQQYRRRYTFRRANIHTVHLVFTAALIHVHHAYLSTNSAIQSSATKYLDVCSQALSELGLAYKNARRALEVITYIKADLFRCRRMDSLSGGTEIVVNHAGTRYGWQRLEPLNMISPSMLNLDSYDQHFAPTFLYEEISSSLQSVDTESVYQIPDGLTSLIDEAFEMPPVSQ